MCDCDPLLRPPLLRSAMLKITGKKCRGCLLYLIGTKSMKWDMGFTLTPVFIPVLVQQNLAFRVSRFSALSDKHNNNITSLDITFRSRYHPSTGSLRASLR